MTPTNDEVKRARNRRGREGEDVDELEELLEFLLVQDAEALLFVDHDQAEILENDVARDETMGADDDVDAAVAELFQHLALLGMGAEAAQHFDPHRVVEHALTERLKVLLREDGRGGEDRDLFAFHDGLEGGANRHLRFAEPDIAADEAIHRARLFHVAFGLGDRL